MTTIILHLGIVFHLKLNERLDVNLHNYSPGMHSHSSVLSFFIFRTDFNDFTITSFLSFEAENLIKLCK